MSCVSLIEDWRQYKVHIYIPPRIWKLKIVERKDSVLYRKWGDFIFVQLVPSYLQIYENLYSVLALGVSASCGVKITSEMCFLLKDNRFSCFPWLEFHLWWWAEERQNKGLGLFLFPHRSGISYQRHKMLQNIWKGKWLLIRHDKCRPRMCCSPQSWASCRGGGAVQAMSVALPWRQ